jgi:hypothetical protein
MEMSIALSFQYSPGQATQDLAWGGNKAPLDLSLSLSQKMVKTPPSDKDDEEPSAWQFGAIKTRSDDGHWLIVETPNISWQPSQVQKL